MSLPERSTPAETTDLDLMPFDTTPGPVDIHQLPPEETARLAAEHDIYTTTVPRHPGERRGHLANAKKQRVVGATALALSEALVDVPGFEDPDEHATALSRAFNAAHAVHLEG